MKTFKCPCGREKQTADNIVFPICFACQKEMKLFKTKQKLGEDGYSGYN